MNDTILVLNAGSSSFKFQLFDIDSGAVSCMDAPGVARGEVI
jgi:acetate kinase